jgi:hypothetical protein
MRKRPDEDLVSALRRDFSSSLTVVFGAKAMKKYEVCSQPTSILLSSLPAALTLLVLGAIKTSRLISKTCQPFLEVNHVRAGPQAVNRSRNAERARTILRTKKYLFQETSMPSSLKAASVYEERWFHSPL